MVIAADVVRARREAIAILESPTEDPVFTKPQTVRWLVHLVGDLHQPLHATSSYYKTTVASFANTRTRINNP